MHAILSPLHLVYSRANDLTSDPFWETLPTLVIDGRALDQSERDTLLFAAKKFQTHDAPLYIAIRELGRTFRAHVEATLLDTFVWDVLDRWADSETSEKHVYLLNLILLLTTDHQLYRLTPLLLRAHKENSEASSNAMRILKFIGSDGAITECIRLSYMMPDVWRSRWFAESFKVICTRRKLNTHMIWSRFAPDFQLDAHSQFEMDYGGRPIQIALLDDLELYIYRAGSRPQRLTAFPQTLPGDDPIKLAAAQKQIGALWKEIPIAASFYGRCFEQSMVYGQRWTWDAFTRDVLAHPFLARLIGGLVWGSFGPDAIQLFRVADDGRFVGADDRSIDLDRTHPVGIPHPLELNPATLLAWSAHVIDFDLLQPFSQLGRTLYAFSERELATNRVQPVEEMTMFSINGYLFEDYGWKKQYADNSFIKHFAGDSIIAQQFYFSRHESIVFKELNFYSTTDRQLLPYTTVPPIVASEVLRDLTLLYRGGRT